MSRTAEEWRDEAAAHERERARSVRDSDTDGFVSQWASGLSGELARVKADIAEHGGRATFKRLGLLTLDGEVTDGRMVNTRYGQRWRRDETDEWLPCAPKREGTLAKRGYREVTEVEVAPVEAMLWSSSGARGLSGATQVSVRIYRPDRPRKEGWLLVGLGDVTGAPASPTASPTTA